jgi:GMP synthase-like glutamine amidotransferase
MKKPLFIFRHVACEGPGHLAQVLADHGVPFRILAIDRGDDLPDTVDEASGLIFMGGPMSVNDPLPWIGCELDLIRQAADRRMPVLGHCLGGQLISRALGGEVGTNTAREIGWHPVSIVPNRTSRSWMEGLPASFEVFHWHSERFSIPKGAEPVLQSDYCANQAFAVDNILALQCHVEMTVEMVTEWVHLYADEIRQPTESVQDAALITAGIEERITRMQGIANRLYRRWLLPLLEQ